MSSSGDRISGPKSSNPEKRVVFTYGRFQPPHIGHALLISQLHEIALQHNATPYVIVTASCNENWLSSGKYKKQRESNIFESCKPNENPLPIKRKVYYLRKMFPTTKFIGANNYGSNIFNVIGHLKDIGYTKFIGVFGSDRAATFETMFTNAETSRKQKIEEDPSKEEEYPPLNIIIQSVGNKRNDKVDDVTGASGTKMREAAITDTPKSREYFIRHSQIGNMTIEDSLEMMKEIREALWEEYKEEPEEVKEKLKRKSKKKETVKETAVEEVKPVRRSSRLAKPTEGGYVAPKVVHKNRPKHYKLRPDEIYSY
jgi:nicotinic acid mononucleotide adenylyltransferase